MFCLLFIQYFKFSKYIMNYEIMKLVAQNFYNAHIYFFALI